MYGVSVVNLWGPKILQGHLNAPRPGPSLGPLPPTTPLFPLSVGCPLRRIIPTDAEQQGTRSLDCSEVIAAG